MADRAALSCDAGDTGMALHSIARPKQAVAAFAVLTKASAAEVGARLERGALAESIRGETCGDEAGCAAVRATVADAHATTLETRELAEWGMPAGEGRDSMTTPVDVENLPAASPVTGAPVDVADYIFDPGDGGKQRGDSLRVLEGVP